MRARACAASVSVITMIVSAGHPRGVLDSSHGGEFQPYLGRQSSEESSQFHEELASLSSALTEVQETFTQLLENFDSCAPYTSQQARAMNQLWAYYNSHADELEAGAADLESLLSSRHHFALDQNAIHRSSTIPSPLSQRNVSLATYNRPNQHFVKQQARRHRRSHSLS